MNPLPSAIIKSYREKTFRFTDDLKLHSADDAVKFVNERGFIFFWPIKDIPLPSLWNAVAGDRPVPDDHDDAGHITWTWKDELLDKRVWYYGRILKKRNTIISLETIPYFYALSPNYGSPEDDILEQYHQGLLPLEAKLIFETLLSNGAMDTLALRREAHLSGTNSNGPFTRALDLLQKNLQVLPVGIAEVGTWRYAFIYELTHRYFPDLLEDARKISEKEARIYLLKKLITSCGAITVKQISSLFSWNNETTQKTIKHLEQTETIYSDVPLENSNQTCVCLAELYNRCS